MFLSQDTVGSYEAGGNVKTEYSRDELIDVPCPLCGATQHDVIYVENGAIGVAECARCGLIYTNPRVKDPEAVYWGEADKYGEEVRLIFEGRGVHHRDKNYREELALIRRYKPTGRFLDVGCNMGFLLNHVREGGWTAVGVEPSKSLAKFAIEHHHHQVYNCFLEEMPESEKGAFDVIAMSDVLEHIPEPLPFLKKVSEYLAPDGIVYIKVPNARWNYFKQKMAERQGHKPQRGLWNSFEHMVHYTDESLAKMLRAAGFRVSRMTIQKPIQVPVWHFYVGRYYQHASPWILDWKRNAGRTLLFNMSLVEYGLRGGSIGALAPNVVAVARKR